MKFEIGRRFEKETDRLSDDLQAKVYEAIRQIEVAETLDDLTNVKKLKGFKNAYRIKIGDYRIGYSLKTTPLFLVGYFIEGKSTDTFPKKQRPTF